MNSHIESDEMQSTPTDIIVHLTAQSSARHARQYADSHKWQRGYSGSDDIGALSKARLQALLDIGRKELAGKFSRDELANMLNAFGECMFTPDDLTHLDVELAEALVDDAGDTDDADAELVQRLSALSPVARFALGDALEWALFEGLPQDLSVAQCFERLQLKLTDAAEV